MDEEKSGSSTPVKRRCYPVGYFRLPCGRRTRHCRSRAGARLGMCELTHGMAWERHALCESALRNTLRNGFWITYVAASYSVSSHDQRHCCWDVTLWRRFIMEMNEHALAISRKCIRSYHVVSQTLHLNGSNLRIF